MLELLIKYTSTMDQPYRFAKSFVPTRVVSCQKTQPLVNQ
jgi:hypothetical protein